MRYEKDIGLGTLVVRTEATQFRKQANKLFADELLDDVNGNINAPKIAGLVDVAYTRGAWRYRYGFDFLGTQDSTVYLEEVPGETVFDFRVGTYMTHFASVRYKADKWEVTAGMRNLFDKAPPMISAGAYNRVGNAALYSGYDYFGRTGFVNFAKKF